MSGEGKDNPGLRSPQCVLWHATGDEPPQVLSDALQRRGITPRGFGEPHAALAALCITAQQIGPDGIVIFLVVEPVTLPAVSEVLEAARIYAPSSRLWVYSDHDRDQLRQITNEDIESWGKIGTRSVGKAQGAAHSGSETGGTPKLKLVNDIGAESHALPPEDSPELGGDDLGKSAESDESAEDPSSLLTDDELSMLLDDDPEDDEGH